MKFLDQAKVYLKAGDGGNGIGVFGVKQLQLGRFVFGYGWFTSRQHVGTTKQQRQDATMYPLPLPRACVVARRGW